MPMVPLSSNTRSPSRNPLLGTNAVSASLTEMRNTSSVEILRPASMRML